ncbi:MAG: ATP-binding protein [Bacteroidales bacterium]|nr:ATP-binding protein [Bacteroidales bacterium]
MEINNIIQSRYARSLIEASRDPLFTISPNGKITDINNASINITEVTRENLIGTDFFEYFTEPEKAREIYKQVFEEGFVVDFPLTIRDGKFTDVLFNGSVYRDEFGVVLGVVVVARDITDHKRIEAELMAAKQQAELTTKIAEEAQIKAEKAAQTAEEATRSKQQFLSNMSHEIRTPMNAIIGFTKVLLKTELSIKQKEYLDAIKISGQALIVLINDILDLAKVDSGKMIFEKTPFKMRASIFAMIHLFESKIREKNLKLIKNYDPKIPIIVLGDPIRLHQIIINLLSNAVKFTNYGSITFDAALLSEDDDNIIIEFTVTDTGIGIAKDKIKHIFENFQQATSETSRIYGGTGLGLAISKQLVESQGGTISVKSTIEKGSSFRFSLPFQKTNAQAEYKDEMVELKFIDEKLKILVVEDIPLNQLLIKTILDEFGYENQIAENGKIAIEKMKSEPFDLILMDLQMPEMNGFEATEYIRKTMNSQIPIIALTADVTTVDLNKCKDFGMNDYITKPLDERLLYNKIHALLLEAKHKKNAKAKKITKTITPKHHEKYVDLTYLVKRTKAKPELMIEMIALYLNQTPVLVKTMKKSLSDKDWKGLYSAVHKLIPSFVIMGMNQDFEDMAKKIQEYAGTEKELDKISDLVTQVTNACSKACKELHKEFEASLKDYKINGPKQR